MGFFYPINIVYINVATWTISPSHATNSFLSMFFVCLLQKDAIKL